MRSREIPLFWLCAALGTTALRLFASCEPLPPVTPVAATTPTKPLGKAAEDPQPDSAYCVPHLPSTDKIAFTLDYDGSDGTREPRFADAPSSSGASPDPGAEPTRYSVGARGLCQSSDKPNSRRYLLRVPINTEPRRLDEFVRYAARRGYDQPIFTVNKAVVAAQIENAEYTYSPASTEGIKDTIGTLTIEATADAQYELRARVTDGYEQSKAIGQVTLPPNPRLKDCDSKMAEAVQQLCANDARPCDRVTLVGVNDIGALLSVFGYVQAIAEVPLPAVSFHQHRSGTDATPYQDSDFRRVHRIKRFFASKKPETERRALAAKDSLAKKNVGLYGKVPAALANQTKIALGLQKELNSKHWTEFGKSRTCDQPGRIAASVVLDKNDKVRMYAERVAVTARSEMLLRAYYDEAERLRMVVGSETTDSGEKWDAYLILSENGCPTEEQIATSAEPSASMLHWELKQLVDPKAAYSEPLCIGQVP